MTGFKLKSSGERVVQTILEENNISFEGEKSINTGRVRPQRLDFYIELNDKKYAIEYMGQQHFKQATGSWNKPIEHIQELDRIKKEYCESNNISLLYINHPLLDKKEILRMISEFLNIDLEYTEGIKDFYIGTEREKEVIDFYMTHSIRETEIEFDMTRNEVHGLMNRRGVIKRFKKVVGLNIKTLEEVEFDTLKEAQEWIGSAGVRGCVTGNRKSCKGYLWRYKEDDFSEVAKSITDKRIKIYKATKGLEVIKLPLHMMTKRIDSDVATIVNCSKGKLSNAKGYNIEEIEGEEKEEVLNSISYIDYIQNYK